MEIRNIRTAASFAACPTRTAGEAEVSVRSSADRVEQSLRWMEQMEDQRKQLLSFLSQPAGQAREKRSDGLLDMLDGLNGANEEIDAMSHQLNVKMKCLEIARRIMQGKKVPIKDERYLMENDPKGYQLAMAMRRPPKKDEKECKSVLDGEDEQSGKTSGGGEAAPADASGGYEGPAASDSGESTEV